MRITGLVVQIAADAAKLKAGLQQATAGVRAFQTSVEGVAAGVSKQFDAIAQSARNISPELASASSRAGMGLAALGTAIAGVATAGVVAAAQAEQTAVAFRQLTGSAEEAARILDDLRKLADYTPFQTQEIVESGRQLLSMGFAAETVVGSIYSIGEAVSSIGGGAQQFQTVILALGKIRNTGKATLESINMISDMGIPALQLLADRMGTSVSAVQRDITRGAVSSNEAIKGILLGFMNQYEGMMMAQSMTLGGLFSTAQGAVKNTLTQIGQAVVEAFDLKGVMNSAIEQLNRINEWASNGGITRAIQAIKDNFGLLAGVIGGVLAPSILKAATALRMGLMLPFIKFIAVGAVVGTALQSLGVQFGSWNSIIRVSAAALTGLIQILRGVIKMAASIVTAVAEIILAVQALGQSMYLAGVGIKKALTFDFSGAKESFDQIGTTWSTWYSAMEQRTGALFRSGWSDIADGVTETYGLIQEVVTNGMDATASAIPDHIGDFMSRMAAEAREAIENADFSLGGEDIAGGIAATTSGLKALQDQMQALDTARQIGQVGLGEYVAALQQMRNRLQQTLASQTPLTEAWTETADALLRVKEAIGKARPEALTQGLELLSARFQAGMIDIDAYTSALAEMRAQAGSLVTDASANLITPPDSEAFISSVEALERVMRATLQGSADQVEILSAQLAGGVVDLRTYTAHMAALEEQLRSVQGTLPQTSSAWAALQRAITSARETARRPFLEGVQRELETLSLNLQLGGVSLDQYRMSLTSMLERLQVQIRTVEMGTDAWNEMARAIARLKAEVEDLKTAPVDDFITKINEARRAVEGLATALLAIDTQQLLASLGRVAEEISDIAAKIPGGQAVSVVSGVIATAMKVGQSLINYLRSNRKDVQREMMQLQDSLRLIDVTPDIASISSRRRGGFAGMMGVRQYTLEINQLALDVANALDQGILSALQTSIRGLLSGSATWMEDLKTGVRDAITNAITEAVLQGSIIRGAFGGLLNDLTNQIASGQMSAAALTIQRIAQVVPTLAATLDNLLGPLKGALAGLGGTAADAGRSITGMAAALTNVPAGFKVALSRFDSINTGPEHSAPVTIEVNLNGTVYGTPDLESRIRTAITTAQRETSLARYSSPVAA